MVQKSRVLEHGVDDVVALGHAKPIYEKPYRADSLYSRFGKRLFDLVFVMLALPIALPMFAILYLIVRRDGPFLFSHVRVGRGGQLFRCHKIRTMKVNARELLEELIASDPEVAKEWNASFKLRNDPRTTKIGRALRKTSLDELPQLLNILKGEMSVVGPRPITEEELARYGQQKHLYEMMRPGLTGPWQVSGRRDNDFDSRAGLDADYARNVSFLGDLAIMLRTVPEVVLAHGR